MDGLIADVDADELIAAILRIGNERAEAAVDRAAIETSEAIVREARARLRRQLGPRATGVTAAGITITRADRGGYLVGSARQQFPNLPLWIEKGTDKGKPRSHAQAARPYFYDSAELEELPHLQRVSDEIQREIDAEGLGA